MPSVASSIAIGALQAHRHEAEDRGDVHDRAGLARAHRRGDGAAHQEHAGEVDGDHLVPGLDREGIDRLAVAGSHADSGIVDQDVDAPVAGEDVGDARGDRRAVGDIDGDGIAPVAGRLAHAVEVAIAEHDGRAVADQSLGAGLADAGRSTGDQGHPAREIDLHVSTPSSRWRRDEPRSAANLL
jgi:hypothetical protein